MLRGATLIRSSFRKEEPCQVRDLRDNGSTVRAYWMPGTSVQRNNSEVLILGGNHRFAATIGSLRVSRARHLFVIVVEVFKQFQICYLQYHEGMRPSSTKNTKKEHYW